MKEIIIVKNEKNEQIKNNDKITIFNCNVIFIVQNIENCGITYNIQLTESTDEKIIKPDTELINEDIICVV